MKKLLYSIIGLIVLSVSGWVMLLNNRYHSNIVELERYKAVVDSVEAIKAMPPDTIVRDTVIYKDTTIYVTNDFETPSETDVVNQYSDSLVNEDVHVWIDIEASKLYNVKWNYQPIVRQSIKTINTPYPVIVNKPVETIIETRGVYFTGGLGFGDSFVGRVGLSYMPNSRLMYGLDVTRVGSQTVYGLNTAFRLSR